VSKRECPGGILG